MAREKPKFENIRALKGKPLVTLKVKLIRKTLKDTTDEEGKDLLFDVEDLAPGHEVSIEADRWQRCQETAPKPKDNAPKGDAAPKATPTPKA